MRVLNRIEIFMFRLCAAGYGDSVIKHNLVKKVRWNWTQLKTHDCLKTKKDENGRWRKVQKRSQKASVAENIDSMRRNQELDFDCDYIDL